MARFPDAVAVLEAAACQLPASAVRYAAACHEVRLAWSCLPVLSATGRGVLGVAWLERDIVPVGRFALSVSMEEKDLAWRAGHDDYALAAENQLADALIFPLGKRHIGPLPLQLTRSSHQ